MANPSGFLIEIELPLAPIIESASRALDALMRDPARVNCRGGEGYEVLKAKVVEHIESFDVVPIVAQQVEEQIRGVVAEVLSDALASVVRSRVGEMKRDGSLAAMALKILPSPPDPDSSEDL